MNFAKFGETQGRSQSQARLGDAGLKLAAIVFEYESAGM